MKKYLFICQVDQIWGFEFMVFLEIFYLEVVVFIQLQLLDFGIYCFFVEFVSSNQRERIVQFFCSIVVYFLFENEI